ncbi:DUF229 domain containing [Brachionus plicatilis]|uniref:DUF229 domain containing n=1 Tax=Brachionus plicatilis TaxID=10195 RepID=A0A3M7SUW6_BRAPC|nr:DUF229 domain containing [Brachionus plicatilis]
MIFSEFNQFFIKNYKDEINLLNLNCIVDLIIEIYHFLTILNLLVEINLKFYWNKDGSKALFYSLIVVKFRKKVEKVDQNHETCRIPELNYRIEKTNLKPNPVCQIERNWGSIDRKTYSWSLDNEITQKISSINCKYRKISRIDDFRIHVGELKNLEEGNIITDDVFEVRCDGINKAKNNSEYFNNLYVQVVDVDIQKHEERKIDVDKNECFPYDVILLSYDSVSRVSFVNGLKQTFEFINKTENFFVLGGYNILGDGTPAALIPIYTGKTEEELPSGLKNDPNGKYVDEIYPFIWKDLHKKVSDLCNHNLDWMLVTTLKNKILSQVPDLTLTY